MFLKDYLVARSDAGTEAIDLSRTMALSDILAPIHEEFCRSGMTEEELSALIEEARDETMREAGSMNEEPPAVVFDRAATDHRSRA